LEYSRWFYFDTGGKDSLTVYLNKGLTTVQLEFVKLPKPAWVSKSFKIANYITPTATMKLIVRIADNAPDNNVIGGFDKFFITEGPSGVEEIVTKTTGLQAYPNPFTNQLIITYDLNNHLSAGASLVIMDLTGRTVDYYSLTEAKGTIDIHPQLNAGIYFVKLMNGGQTTETLKIVKVE
jgi:hypothetical protein